MLKFISVLDLYMFMYLLFRNLYDTFIIIIITNLVRNSITAVVKLDIFYFVITTGNVLFLHYQLFNNTLFTFQIYLLIIHFVRSLEM